MTRQRNTDHGTGSAVIAIAAGMTPVFVVAASSEARIEIAAPSERVWDLLANIDRWPMWNPHVQEAVLRGPLHPGGIFRWKSKGLTVVSTLHEVSPNCRLAWTGRAFGTRAIHTWELERTELGVLLRTAEAFDGWLPKLMPNTMKRTLDATLVAWLKAIKAEAEGEPHSGPNGTPMGSSRDPTVFG